MRLHEYNINFRQKKKKKSADYIKQKIDIRFLNIPGILDKKSNIIENLVKSNLSSDAIIKSKVLDIAVNYKYKEYAQKNLI